MLALLTSHHHTLYLTCYFHIPHLREPLAAEHRTVSELVVLFVLLLQIYGTHYHHIFAMQHHINNSRNYKDSLTQK